MFFFYPFFCRFGRIKGLLLSNVINFVAGIAMAVVPSYISILVLRAVLGFSIKGGWMTAYVLRKNDRLSLLKHNRHLNIL